MPAQSHAMYTGPCGQIEDDAALWYHQQAAKAGTKVELLIVWLSTTKGASRARVLNPLAKSQ